MDVLINTNIRRKFQDKNDKLRLGKPVIVQNTNNLNEIDHGIVRKISIIQVIRTKYYLTYYSITLSLFSSVSSAFTLLLQHCRLILLTNIHTSPPIFFHCL